MPNVKARYKNARVSIILAASIGLPCTKSVFAGGSYPHLVSKVKEDKLEN